MYITKPDSKEKLYNAVGYALLVGIQQTDIPGYNNIKGVDKSINKIQNILEERGFTEVQTLENSPGRNAILDALKNKLDLLGPNDLFVFYFIGHGNQRDNTDGHDAEDDDKDEFLVAKDGIILDDEIHHILLNSNTQGRIVFIVEACHSGTTYKLFDNFFKENELQPQFPNFIYLGASNDADESILYSQGGIYTDKLYRLWKRRNADQMNYQEVFNKLKTLKQKPVFKTEYATVQFINQLFLKL